MAKIVIMQFRRFSTLTRISANTLRISPTEMRARADECERLADSLTPTPDDLRKMLREIAAQWRRLADDGEAHPKTLTWAGQPSIGRAVRPAKSMLTEDKADRLHNSCLQSQPRGANVRSTRRTEGATEQTNVSRNRCNIEHNFRRNKGRV
jgi:hypothetical protein